MIRAITMMTISSGMPMGPNILEVLEKPGGCTPSSNYRNGVPGGQPITLDGARKSLHLRHLVCYDAFMRTSRFFPVAVLAVVLSAAAGGVLGSSLLARQDDVSTQLRIYTAALDAIDKQYAETLPQDRLIYGSIDGMLKTLDPHSS